VVVIVMENKEFSSIIGSPKAPYMNALARKFGLATRYYANTHPSLPNYLDLIAGKDFGIDDDGEHYVLGGTSLVDQLEAAGLTWRAYMEGMPEDATAPCRFPSGGERYRKKHNPFAYFEDIQSRSGRCRKVVASSRLTRDLADGLRNFTWITPNGCHDMHDCSIQTGDAWLASNVPLILAKLSERDLLFLTFDEGSSSKHGGGRVASIVAGPGAKPQATSSVFYTHFSLLRTIEDLFGLGHLGHAADRGVRPMSDLIRSPP
jgi:hypothetical protein